MRPKVSLELKMEALKLLQTGLSVQSVSKQFRITSGELQTWSLIYAKEDERGLAAYPKNICTGSIKDKITYYTSNGNVYPNLIKQLKEASSVEEQVQVFLSYSK